MNSEVISMILVPGLVALLLGIVFTYLYEQSRRPYFRAWQFGWIAYTLYYGLHISAVFQGTSAALSILSSLLLVGMGLCVFISIRLFQDRPGLRWYDFLLASCGVGFALWDVYGSAAAGLVHSYQIHLPNLHLHLRLETALGLLFAYCAFSFYRESHRRSSFALSLLAFSLALWAVLLSLGPFRDELLQVFGSSGSLLGPVPQMLLGVAMVMVLFENERNAVQENALAFSTLGVDSRRLLSSDDLVPSMQSVLDRLISPLPMARAVICISERWRTVLPSVQRGYSAEFVKKLEAEGAGDYISELTYRRGGFVSFRNVSTMAEPLPSLPGTDFEKFRQVLRAEKISHLTAVSLQTREHNFGVILFPYADRRRFGASNLRLLTGLALQIGLTLENYVVMHETQRRTMEYELLTQIGQAISSRLDQDEVLRAVQKELGQIFDTSNFYIAFQEGDAMRYELEMEKGVVLPKRSRKVGEWAY